MKDNKVFVDTNIIVYAYDASAGEKHEKAFRLMEDLWNSGVGIISSQVLQEFFVIITKKIRKPLDITIAKDIVKDLLKWETIMINGNLILEAIDIHKKHKFSFWDSIIIASALEGGAQVISSEDFPDLQTVKGVVMRNPFTER
jgi:predicted nucleic acid-binding protein